MNCWLKGCFALTLLCGRSVSVAAFPENNIQVKFSAQSLIVQGELIHGTASLKVFAKDSRHALFGVSKQLLHGVSFDPTVPFLQGRTYRVEVEKADGTWENLELSFGPVIKAWDIAASPSLIVRISPDVREIPANTLKLYIDCSHPMEQGDFLRQVTLQKKDGSAVAGAFRETELWSPDGKRLTLMFHPGRQKTGVNLNVDEGPVLVAGERYTLLISGQWRSDEGVPLGKEAAFVIEPVAADHAQPDPQRWHVSPPKKQTRERLTILTDEIFEPAIFSRALKVQRHGESITGAAKAEIADLKRTAWTFLPEREWQAGIYEIHIDPLLEDLAGNNLVRPFEVDVSQAQPAPAMKQTKLRFEVR